MKIKLLTFALFIFIGTAWAGPAEDEVLYKRAEIAINAGDSATFLQLMRTLSTQGQAIAQTNLGLIYEKSQGVAQDPVEAARWYKLAAVQGHAKAQYLLGLKYVIGHGVAKDYAQAIKWLGLAAAQGKPDAQYQLGTMHHNGQGVIQDYKEAAKWIRLAAAQGNDSAQASRDPHPAPPRFGHHVTKHCSCN
jgi:TPR repeat protein